MNRGVPIGRIAGIRVTADWSVLVIGVLLAWGVAGGAVPAAAPHTPLWLAWVAGSVVALLLIGSLAAHELGHAVLARRRGIAVEGIRLWLFGGVAQMSGDWMTGRTEMLVAAVGPAITFVVAAVSAGVTWVLATVGAPNVVVLVPEYLAALNILLLVFNLIPAFPLDGGRILRGFIWSRTNNRLTATVIAARAGRVFAIALVRLGGVALFFFDLIGGFWLMLIRWVLAGAGRGGAT